MSMTDRIAQAALAAATQANKSIAPYDYCDAESRVQYIPQFDKKMGDPMYTAAMAGLQSMYWFRAIKVKGLIPEPKADYYATYSTNHNRAGGIGLAYSNSPTGPWTKHGRVYLDTVVGNSTETPFVICNDIEKLFFMYYQQKGLGINQSTALATSKDMINWTRVGLIIDKPPGFPGDGHTGYFSCYRYGGKWIGFSLMGGNDATLSAGENFSRSNAGVFVYKGNVWWLGMLSEYHSGGVVTVARPAIAKISTDFRQLIERPSNIYFPALAWETTNMQSMMVSVMDGVVYVYYNTDSNVGDATQCRCRYGYT